MAHGTIVSTAELARHLHDPSWVVFDCRHDLADPRRGRLEYVQSHIPGARFLHLDDDLSSPRAGRNGRHPLPGRATLKRKLEAAGVGDATQVIAYDAQGGMVAARLWWLVRWLGHFQVAVLDGGWPRWIGESRPVSTDIPSSARAALPEKGGDDTVDATFVQSHLRNPEIILLDARAPDRYRGLNETLDPVGGRIPGARNRCFRDNLGPDGGFKPAAALRRELAAALGDGGAGAHVIHYCGSGVSACHNILAMELAGLPAGRLYPGSWSEWCADPSRPMATGEPDAREK